MSNPTGVSSHARAAADDSQGMSSGPRRALAARRSPLTRIQTWCAPTSEVWQARRAAMFLRDMNERVEEAEIFARHRSSRRIADAVQQQELRSIVSYTQAEALMRQDAALENRTRWQVR